MDALKDILFGSIAGMASKIFEHPFDLTKVRLQSQLITPSGTGLRFTGPFDCLTKTYKYEGIPGLYRGLPAPLVGAMAENASLFLAYEELQKLIRYTTKSENLSLGEKALAACGSGSITSFILTPIELVKCRMQVSALANPPGPISVFLAALREGGVKGLWTGHTGTFIRETGGTCVWFGTKEAVATYLLSRRGLAPGQNVKLTTAESAISGACAGAAFNLAFFPADTIKSAMQTTTEARSPSFVNTLKSILATSGPRGLYAGCGITILRSMPSSAGIFVIWDGLWKLFPSKQH